jgi:signal transduction histidine kinase
MNEKAIWQYLRAIQWIIAAGAITIYALRSGEGHTTVIYPTAWYGTMIVFMILPILELLKDKENWRFGWLLAQVAALCLSCMLAGWRSYPILLMSLAAKASTMIGPRKLNIFLSCLSVGFVLAIEIGLAFHLHRAGSNLSPNVRLFGRLESEAANVVMIWAIGLLGKSLLAEQRARKLTESLTQEIQNMAVALERTRIAQDIHDKLGHTLTSLGIQLELTSKHLQKKQIEQCEEALATAQQLSADSFMELRRAIQAIRDDFDLNEAMVRLAEKIEEQQKIKVELDVERADLPPPSRHELFCIAQECLTNIQKHAQATEVKISLKNIEDTIQLTVEDNGIGVQLDRPSSGFGLRGMMNRAKGLGGRLEINKAAPRGTVVRVIVPA